MISGFDYDFWKLALDTLQTVAIVGAWIYARATRQSEVNQGVIKTLSADIVRLDKDVSGLGIRLDAGPSHADVEKIHSRVSEVKKEVSAVAESAAGIQGEMNGIRRAVELLTRVGLGGSGD